MADELVMLDPRLWAIVAVSVLSLYLIDRFCRWIIGRNTRWSRARKRVAQALMLFFFFVLISTIAFYYAVAVVF
jgi:membrane-anchored protein YejM (alkaline phosphatase superfamily)